MQFLYICKSILNILVTQSALSGPNSDFEAVLGRVGMDINKAGKISQGNGNDDMLSFDIPRATAPSSFESNVNYGGLTKEEEERMLAAARSDLVKLLNLPVSCPYKLIFYLILKLLLNNAIIT